MRSDILAFRALGHLTEASALLRTWFAVMQNHSQAARDGASLLSPKNNVAAEVRRGSATSLRPGSFSDPWSTFIFESVEIGVTGVIRGVILILLSKTQRATLISKTEAFAAGSLCGRCIRAHGRLKALRKL